MQTVCGTLDHLNHFSAVDRTKVGLDCMRFDEPMTVKN